MYPPEIEERFWAKVSTGEEDACWEWTAYKNGSPGCRGSSYGYGQFQLWGNKVQAHRVAWELTNGEIPEGLCVLHKCDNHLCCNPSHLFLGTRGDNNRDAKSKGRSRALRGRENPLTKYTAAQIITVKLLSDCMRTKDIAEVMGIPAGYISSIKGGLKWKYIQLEYCHG